MVDLVFRKPPDHRTRLTVAIGLEQLGPMALAEGAVFNVCTQDFSQQVGGVHQCFFGGLAHAGADFLHHGVEHEVAGQADKQRIHQENPQPKTHQLWLGL